MAPRAAARIQSSPSRYRSRAAGCRGPPAPSRAAGRPCGVARRRGARVAGTCRTARWSRSRSRRGTPRRGHWTGRSARRRCAAPDPGCCALSGDGGQRDRSQALQRQGNQVGDRRREGGQTPARSFESTRPPCRTRRSRSARCARSAGQPSGREHQGRQCRIRRSDHRSVGIHQSHRKAGLRDATDAPQAAPMRSVARRQPCHFRPALDVIGGWRPAVWVVTVGSTLSLFGHGCSFRG